MCSEQYKLLSGTKFIHHSTQRKMKRYIVVLLLCLTSTYAQGQDKTKINVRDKKTGRPLESVIVSTQKDWLATTDSTGTALVSIAAGAHKIIFTLTGYENLDTILALPSTEQVSIYLQQAEETLDEVVVLSTTRNNERIENSTLKVEALGEEELGEENTIKPANIASILGDVSGVQIQQSSVVSGNANVRIQGLSGQYTQMLRDGMPLYDGLSGGFGILQVAPLDLRQVELVKGSASTLYGGGAIAGLVNLISKRPKESQEAIFTLNATTLNEQNLNMYVAKRYKKFGYTFFGGYTQQSAVDVNGDGLSDVPELKTATLHPRLFFYPNQQTTIIAGYSLTAEQRKGGDLQVINGLPDSLHRYYEQNKTTRHTGELIVERALKGTAKLTVKGSMSAFDREVTTNTYSQRAGQINYYGEASVYVPHRKNNLVAGINTTGDAFTKKAATVDIALPDYQNNVVGAFAQYTLHLREKTTIDGGLRADHTASYGDFILPRVAFFHRFSEVWGIRGGVGMGYKTPNPLQQQITDYSLQQLLPLPDGIKAERSVGYNLEGNFKKDISKDVSLFLNHAFFRTEVTDPIVVGQYPNGTVAFYNAAKPVVTMGFDTYVKLTVKTIELYLGYTYTDARRTYLPENDFMPLTPRDRMAFTAVKEWEGKWRIGLEGSYFGGQYRDADSKTPGYFFAAMMVERKIGKKFSITLNGENLLDYRQTNHEQIYTGSISAPSFKPLWAPIDGRVINLAVRITPFS
jgi:iron complex outermembrane receptor protein/outer membrane receptor for ferrienterochelin and colicins